MFLYTYRCDTCDFTGCARSLQIGYYVFPDGERMPAKTTVGWCRRCNDFSVVEDLPSSDSVVDEIKRMRNKEINDFDLEMIKTSGRDLDEYVASRIAAFKRIDYRFRHRKSANRCVECGTTEFDLVESADGMPNKLPHANCGGTMHLGEWGHAIPATYFTLDTEGNRIPAQDVT